MQQERNLYFIQGVIFNGDSLCHFAGIIKSVVMSNGHVGCEDYEGFIHDEDGHYFVLTNIEIGDSLITFVKTDRDGQNDVICALRKHSEADLWFGKYGRCIPNDDINAVIIKAPSALLTMRLRNTVDASNI